MIKTHVIVVCLMALCIVSCAYVQPLNINMLRKGMKSDDIVNTALVKKYTTTLSTYPSVKAEFYVLNFHTTGIYGDYFLAFEDNELFFWGFPSDFARSYDPHVNEFGKAALKEYLK